MAQWGKITVGEGDNQLQTYPISYRSTAYVTIPYLESSNYQSNWGDNHITYSSKSQFRLYSGQGTWRYISIGQ